MTQAFEQITARCAAPKPPNVDTDAIIPKQFLKSIRRTGFGVNLFYECRYLDAGIPGKDCAQRTRNPEFPLNQPRYAGAQNPPRPGDLRLRLESRARSLGTAGVRFRALVAPSFGDIFYANCFKKRRLTRRPERRGGGGPLQ